MKITKALLVIASLSLVTACTTVREDPRSYSHGRYSTYENKDANSSHDGHGRVRINVSEPQPAPIRVKPGTQPTQYINTTSPYDAPPSSTVSPYDRPGSSPLRHDTPDQPLNQR
jgi:hypothetical protein